MPDEILSIAVDFPPVPTSEWEAAIAKDLKGADYTKKLVWRTEEGLAVKPYYRREDLQGAEGQPLVRGDGGKWKIAQDFTPGPDAVRADWLHEAGAHAVQELGYALAAGVEKLAAGAQAVDFVFAVGSTYFFEIAKFRAFRLLWRQAMAAFGRGAVPMRLAVVTSRRNKSVLDPNTNLLRVTTEALSAVIGGCDSLTVEPFGFDQHIARNVQLILQEESHLDVVADPAAGSYYVETLTDTLGRAAWKLFQQVEAQGGFTAAAEAIEKALAESRQAREKAVSSRRRTMVGVNNFPGPVADLPPTPTSDYPRMAEMFERIQRRTAAHAILTGRRPKVLLLKRGDLKMRMARANFCLNFFGCGGFEMVEAEELNGQSPDLIVLCSSDPEYLPLAQEVCAQVRVPVLVAGNPKDQIAALEAAGVAGFVHVQSDGVETLTKWQDRLGMRAIQ
jgi:methylmalonyl-CoA mutase